MLSNRSWLLSALIIFSAGRFDALAASSAANDEWPAYGNDGGGTRHSPLTQINPGNIKDLKIAWVYQTGEGVSESRAGKKAAFEATPILVDGTLFFSTPFNRVIALDPLSGKEKWRFEPNIDTSGNFSEVTSRGVSTWSGKDGRRRIYLGTIDARLIALDARTGQRCKDFGKGGEVDLTKDVRFISRGDYQVTSPPAV